MNTIVSLVKRIFLPMLILGTLLAPAGLVAAQAVTCPDGSAAPNDDVAQCAVATSTAKSKVCEGVGLTSGTTGCANPTGSPSVDSTIKLVINMLSLLVGVVAVIMVIVGGLKYIMSSGDSNNVNSAKNTILYAIIGLVIVLLAQVIVRFVINKATG